MQVSVGEGDLGRILRRFRAVPGAEVEVVISPDGLDVIANAEGYRTLARWCLVMAHREMEQSHPRWLYALRHLDDSLSRDGSFSIVSRNGDAEHALALRDVGFYRTHSLDCLSPETDASAAGSLRA